MSATEGLTPTEMRFVATPEKGEVSALLLRPDDARALLVLGHGASTNMRHAFLEGLSHALAGAGIATFRYQFPYMEKGGGGRDSRAVLLATVRAAVAAGAAAAPDLPLFAGGHSMSGRMTSNAAAEAPLPGVRGIVFVAFPLHPAGQPGTERADHLDDVTVPMLFLSGTRDDLANLDLLRPVCERLGECAGRREGTRRALARAAASDSGGRADRPPPRATLHLVETADHGFRVLKKSRTTGEPVLEEMARVAAEWMTRMSG